MAPQPEVISCPFRQLSVGLGCGIVVPEVLVSENEPRPELLKVRVAVSAEEYPMSVHFEVLQLMLFTSTDRELPLLPERET